MKNNLMSIFAIVISVVAMLLHKFKPSLEKKVESTETKVDDIALNLAIYIVEFVDKAFGDSTGASKKIRAMNLLEDKLSEVGKTVSEEVLDKTIEKAVTKVKVDNYLKNNDELVPLEKK